MCEEDEDKCYWERVDRGCSETSCGRFANSVTLAGVEEADWPADLCPFCGKEIERE